MIGERETKTTDTNYGMLTMRPYDIAGNKISAFYDSDDNLIFVLDNTINNLKPNVLLVINPDADRKWDEILSDDYDVDLETIRPKQNNKYQKLDIEYSGLDVYDNLINAYNAGTDLDVNLNQLNVLRNSAARHSAMVRLNMANEIISKTNTTIVQTRETIVRLTERVKTLRAKLSATKKEIGRVPTKQSASRVLKLESQIDATNEKLKRAKKRLESAQKRLETATVDAELASDLLNQPTAEIKQTTKQATKNHPVTVAQKHELQTVEPEFDDDLDNQNDDDNDDYDDDDEDFDDNNGVAPLFDKDPEILNEDIAFKPISFQTSNTTETPTEQMRNIPELPEPEPEQELSNIDTDADKDDSETSFEFPYINTNSELPEPAETTSDVSEIQNITPIENKPVLETLSPINSVAKKEPDFEPIPNIPTESIEENRSIMENMMPLPRQPEPEFVPEPVDNTVFEPEATILPEPTPANVPEPVPNVEPEAVVEKPIDNNLIKPMTETMHAEIVGSDNKQKPTLMYYVLLFVLIVLSIFTLWLYQKNTVDSTPVLQANVEKTSVLKTNPKPVVAQKPVVSADEDVDSDSVFLDEQETTPAPIPAQPNDGVDEQENTIDSEPDEMDEEFIPEPSEPVIMDAVPARVTTSAQTEDTSRTLKTEEEVLAQKPIYEPGAKHDKMFVDSEPETIDTDEPSTEYVDDTNTEMMYVGNEEDVFYDEEEEQYQAEQNEYYEE